MMRLDAAAMARARLLSEIALARYGWRVPLAVLSVLALLGVALWLPAQFARLEAANAAFERARAAPARPLVAQLPPLEVFRNVLSLEGATATQLRVLHQKASELGLAPGQLDLRRQQGVAGVFSQLQLSMPLSGNYLALRKFCGDVLETMPAVSIDQITIKRDEGRAGFVEAQLALSIWQRADAAAPTGVLP